VMFGGCGRHDRVRGCEVKCKAAAVGELKGNLCSQGAVTSVERRGPQRESNSTDFRVVLCGDVG
jgi:hypothetical protein